MMVGDITLSNGVLFIDGTSGDDAAFTAVQGDEIEVTLGHMESEVLVADLTVSFDLADVTSILFWGGNGNDSFVNGFFDEDGAWHGTNIPCDAYGHAGNDILAGGDASDDLYGGPGNDMLFGLLGNDYLFGGDEIDYMKGGEGNDQLYGQAGDDELYGETGDDWVAGGLGNDRYMFHSSAMMMIEDANLGTDTIVELAGEGDDWLDFSDFEHSVTVYMYSVSVQTLSSGYLSLQLYYPEEVEHARGTRYDDVLVGNSRANQLDGMQGNDLLAGLQGNDSYIFGNYAHGWDTVTEYAGQGIDRLNFIDFSGGITVDLSLAGWQTVQSGRLYLQLNNPSEFENVLGTLYNDVIRGNLRDNVLEGAAGDDFLRGRDGNDLLFGNDGDDTLYGDKGIDTLMGSTGDDYLDGGPDHQIDKLYGGLGRDTFVRNHFWAGYWAAEADQFMDFTRGDLIDNRYGNY